MAVFLSPGVYPVEINIPTLPAATGALLPAFIGTAKKGPLNKPVYLSSAAQAVDAFGEPSPESYMMYDILSFFEDGSACYGLRVGVASEDGQPDDLADVAIDTSGARVAGWGRIPVFTGIDYGHINLREASTGTPYSFHSASISDDTFIDNAFSSDHGATTADINFGGSVYTGGIDDSFVLTITGAPTLTTSAKLDGATYTIVRNSDNVVVVSDTLVDAGNSGGSTAITVGDGITIHVTVSAGVLDVGDQFTWEVTAKNRSFSVSVDGATPVVYTMAAVDYSTAADFVTAFNNLLSDEDYLAIAVTLDDGVTVVPQLRTTVAGHRIQITGSTAFCAEVGVSQYAWDIPRGYLMGVDPGPFNFSTSNNRVVLDVISDAASSTKTFTLSTGTSLDAATVAAAIDAAGTVGGTEYWTSFTMTVPGVNPADHVFIVAGDDQELSTLRLRADYTNLKTLRFAQELNILYPYTKAYRGYSDGRVVLPVASNDDPAIPESCAIDNDSDDCLSDTAYYQGVVGYFVATSPGTWLDGYSITLQLYTAGVGNPAGRYQVLIKDDHGVVVDTINDVSFDKNSVRYIENVINPGSKFGGTNGNDFVNWEPRPTYLNNDPDATDYAVRLPSQMFNHAFVGMADGIPTNPAYSSDLDAAIIGNPAMSTGIYAFQNPDTFDITLLCTPGFSSGAVIGQALQLCEARGDVLYIVDPPFGLRPQQVVDWHNGMLLSDLNSAIDSTYGALYWSWGRQLDTFNNIEIWVPPSGKVTSVYSRSARLGQVWSAPAGPNRARIHSFDELEYTPSLGERDLLLGNGNAVNPLVSFPDGIQIFGEKTLDRDGTVLDHVHVRLLLIFVKKNLVRALRNFLWEPNDEILWSQITNTCNPFLGDIQANRGLAGYRTVCDASNNTAQRRDQNQTWVSIFLVPLGVSEVIVLNLVSLRQSATLTAQEILAAGGVVGG